ncbi:hypothetical protein A2U01_0086774, partial [Trifolium medium]|nr:hypothetical protein [Trifolium medium]
EVSTASTTTGDVSQGPTKKRKPPTIPKKQTPQITQGAEAGGATGGDEVPTGTAAELGV